MLNLITRVESHTIAIVGFVKLLHATHGHRDQDSGIAGITVYDLASLENLKLV